MSNTRQVPCGWTKGSELVVKQETLHLEHAWIVREQKQIAFVDGDLPSKDSVAFIWFYTWEECAEFIQWWNEEN